MKQTGAREGITTLVDDEVRDAKRRTNRVLESLDELVHGKELRDLVEFWIRHGLAFQIRLKYDKSQRRFRYTYQLDGGD